MGIITAVEEDNQTQMKL